MKRPLSLIAILIGAAGACSAQSVIRCVDATGKVSYGDTACAPGAKRSELVLPAEPPAAPGLSVPYQPPPPREPLANRPAPSDPGLVILDHQGGNAAEQQRQEAERQRRNSDLAAEEAWHQGYYDYPGGAYGRPAPRPPRDMRPRLRNCDAGGCNDRQGNHYDNKGQLDRYVTPDGRNCRPIGTTVVCN